MRVLGIETATARQSVALVEDEQVLAETSFSSEWSRGGQLLSTLDAVLKKVGMRPHDLDIIAVSVGPGSFTGVRVGLATAKGLVLGADSQLVGVSTLEALAAGYNNNIDGIICGLVCAGRGEVYRGLFSRRSGELTRLSPDAVVSPEAVGLGIDVGGEFHLIGDGAARYGERLERALQGQARLTPEGMSAVPTATAVARLALRQIQGGTMPLGEVVPVYLRRAEAELNWEKGLVKSPLERLAGVNRGGS
jgi:tRNA threonylcarbamoyladenosine biosynthesis protein TsaB